jgi:hypothetical protein
VLNQFGLIRNLTDVKLLSEWGILFLVGVPFTFTEPGYFISISLDEMLLVQRLIYRSASHPQLFEMGLELSLSRLKALARYAFGMGLPQVRLFVLLVLLYMHACQFLITNPDALMFSCLLLRSS